MSETACPKCTFTPIPEFAERCPKCNHLFAYDRVDYTNVTRTRAGGLTGAVTANPWPVAMAMIFAAIVWTLRAGGFIVSIGDPPWVFGVAAFHVLGAMLLLTTSGPAKHIAILASVIAILAAFGRYEAPIIVTVACVLIAIGLIVGTIAEPPQSRIVGGATFAIISSLGTIGALWRTPPPAPPQAIVKVGDVQVSLTLPETWAVAERGGLSVLEWPVDGGYSTNVGLVHYGAEAMLRISREIESPLNEACDDAVRVFGLQPLGPISATDGRVLEGRTPNGGVVRVGCFKKGSRFVALAVVSRDPAPDAVKPLFSELIAALTFK